MRILLVNKFHWNKGGSETYYFELGRILKEKGHKVAYFSMENEKNIKTGSKEFFVKNIEMDSKNIFNTKNIIYSSQNKEIMSKALDEFKPDVVHINNFQRQLSSSIIEAINEKNIPIVYTSHDLQAVCPASAMLNNGKICEKCLDGSKYNCFKNKCLKNSILKSFLGSVEGVYYKNKKIYDKFSTIISPSNFVKNMLIKGNIKSNIVTIHNFIDLSNFKQYKISDEDYALYLGRLSVEKGILNLVKAFSLQDSGNLLIAGDGPEKENIQRFIDQNNLKNRIKLLGFLNTKEVKKYISKSSFVVVPSIWYENCPYSILESFALAKPVIGSKIGGISELIVDGENGYLYDYDDINDLTKKISQMFSDKKGRIKMGRQALKICQKEYDVDNYYEKLIKVYEKVVGDINVK